MNSEEMRILSEEYGAQVSAVGDAYVRGDLNEARRIIDRMETAQDIAEALGSGDFDGARKLIDADEEDEGHE